ncbi:hypothetical protein CGRA01v4_12801 [Colletotrichum graminicola]|nr:hypothetical protein CGRA01v4_12801 [Colletotrichum graminicola]
MSANEMPYRPSVLCGIPTVRIGSARQCRMRQACTRYWPVPSFFPGFLPSSASRSLSQSPWVFLLVHHSVDDWSDIEFTESSKMVRAHHGKEATLSPGCFHRLFSFFQAQARIQPPTPVSKATAVPTRCIMASPSSRLSRLRRNGTYDPAWSP